MGTAQSSMNRITGSFATAVGGIVGGLKKIKEKQPEVKSEESKSETTSGMGNIVKIRPIKRAAHYAAVGQESGQGMIQEKYASKVFSVEDRIKQAQEASSLSIVKKEEE